MTKLCMISTVADEVNLPMQTKFCVLNGNFRNDSKKKMRATDFLRNIGRTLMQEK